MLPIKRCALSASVLFLLLPARRQGGNVNNLCMLCLHDMQMILMDKTEFEVSYIPTRGPLSTKQHCRSDKISNIVIFTKRHQLHSELSLLPMRRSTTNPKILITKIILITYLQDIPDLPPWTCQIHKHMVWNTVFSVNPFIKLRIRIGGLGPSVKSILSIKSQK